MPFQSWSWYNAVQLGDRAKGPTILTDHVGHVTERVTSARVLLDRDGYIPTPGVT